jgi:hypothetical protein
MMATGRVRVARRGRILALPLAAAVIVAFLAYALGGMSWLTSPTIWGATLFVALVLLVAARARRHLSRIVLLAAPIVIGGAASIGLGAWDYVPWLTSPALWLGIVTSALVGGWLVRTERARPLDVVEGLVMGLVLFGLGLIAVGAGVVFFWVVWRPLG